MPRPAADKSCPPSALPISLLLTPASVAAAIPHALPHPTPATADSAPVDWRAHSTLHNSNFDLHSAVQQPAVYAPPAAQTTHGYSTRADMRWQCRSTQPAIALAQHRSISSTHSQAARYLRPARSPTARSGPPAAR